MLHMILKTFFASLLILFSEDKCILKHVQPNYEPADANATKPNRIFSNMWINSSQVWICTVNIINRGFFQKSECSWRLRAMKTTGLKKIWLVLYAPVTAYVLLSQAIILHRIIMHTNPSSFLNFIHRRCFVIMVIKPIRHQVDIIEAH